jgi:hypothetical protein
MDDPACPRDEYDCLIAPLLSLLQSGATDSDLANYLRKQVVKHFGLSPEHYDFVAVAGRLRNWFDRAWHELSEPVTIFVALLDEGTEAWRPVRARPLREVGLLRIMGVDADVSDETWEFPPGAIVRCEQRRFPDGTIGMTAVERAEEAG